MCLKLCKCLRNDKGTNSSMKMVIQLLPTSIHGGGLTSGDVRTWYSDDTTFGIKPLMIIR